MQNKQILLLVLIAALAVAVCVSAAPARGAENPDGVRTVTDVWGRTVEIPRTVGKIVCLGSGAPRLAAYLGVVEKLVGREKHDAENATVLRDYNPVHRDRLAKLPVVGAGGGSGANNGYPEELIVAAPDVILAGFTREAAEELQAQTSIPVVCVRYLSVNFVDDTFYSAMRVFAEVVGAQKRCEEVLAFIDGCKADLSARTSDIPDAGKQKAYAGAVTFSGRHGFAGTYSHFGPFMGIHARHVADEVSRNGYFEADLEKIVVWDPDVLFLDPGNMDLVRDEYKTNPGYFDSLRAVREGRVYTMPSFNNCGTNVSYALMNAYFAGTVLFPERFADIEIAAKSAEILTFLLGRDIYGEMAEQGLYYGVLKIGE